MNKVYIRTLFPFILKQRLVIAFLMTRSAVFNARAETTRYFAAASGEAITDAEAVGRPYVAGAGDVRGRRVRQCAEEGSGRLSP